MVKKAKNETLLQEEKEKNHLGKEMLHFIIIKYNYEYIKLKITHSTQGMGGGGIYLTNKQNIHIMKW